MNDKLYERLSGLLDKGFDPNQQGENGETFLIHAIKMGNKDAVTLLLDNKANPNICERTGISPLYLAVSKSHDDIAEILIKAGADINEKNRDGDTLLYSAAAVNSAILIELLANNGIDVNAGTILSPLHIAVLSEAYDAAEALLRCGADVNIDKDYGTPIFSAVSIYDHTNIESSKRMTRLLIENNADLTIKNIGGETILQVAAAWCAEDIIEIIRENVPDSFVASHCIPDDIEQDGNYIYAYETKPIIGVREHMFSLDLGTRSNIGTCIYNKVEEVVNKHIKTLARKKKQLVLTDDYGNTDETKWNEEFQYFIDRVVIKQLERMKQLESMTLYGNWVLDHEGASAIIKEVVLDILSNDEQYNARCSNEGVSKYSDDIDPYEYEHFCADILKKDGWNARVTTASGDQGVDVFAEKGDLSVVIQCKKYSGPVGNKAVQEAHAGKGFMDASVAAVVTNSSFTASSRQLASSLGIHLLHHDDLNDLDTLLVG